jgi:hypothetical protein
MMSSFLLVVGVGVLAVGLRSFQSPVLFRLGTFGLVATSFLAGWMLADSLALGVVFASTWFLLPWLEILTRVRKLRLPLHRSLEKCPPPPASHFPGFGELSDELESLDYEYVDDVNWRHEDSRHFYRLFYHAEKRAAGAICLVEQDGVSFYYASFSSRSVDGRLFMTWNYPFSYGMHPLPRTVFNRVEGMPGIKELGDEHEVFLAARTDGIGDLVERDMESLRAEVERDLKLQIEHNIDKGILKRDGEEMIRYSLRGMFFLWTQFLREFVRLS